MSRVFCIPGILFLVCALVLSFLVSISLPYLPALDIVRVHFASGALQDGGSAQGIQELRFGVWTACYDDTHGDRTCLPTRHGYSVPITNQEKTRSVNIGSSWTRGLAVHPVATAVTFIALILSLSTHITVTLIASLVAFLAALLTLIAFAIDIALLVFVRHEMGNLLIGAHTITGPGFWLTFASFILLLLAGCTVCFGRRRDRMSGASTSTRTPRAKTGPFWRRKNKA
ncbi:uncharacterized protein LACBIDRAFT_319082 [Laccaria bicolor S238N-H82]|uniref:Predicted protein n=1 Tax=Laccaria bicolor (strain S238N-H82 / ATCC MYA-4686) TaxID=486041 RepID=B0D7U2_LACBS|nr:uncharacterized protein LACBIDRAFT_319082 [Laccaria bicolor S238N-H82]EDR09461.1 predicted protein [Laccaria bicolor S238N-H82]|eukprot:XP_001879810.1 predicted protein [Laccaria bicolor S238N-H82]